MLDVNNPIFRGGVGLMVLGGALATLRSIPARGMRIVRSKLFVECVVDNDDDAFLWLSLWLGTRPELQRAGNLRVKTIWRETDGVGPDDKDSGRELVFAPGDGEQLISYKGARFWITSSTKDPQNGGQRLREIRIRCMKRKRKALQAMLEEALATEKKPLEGITKVFIPTMHGWSLHARKRKRPLASVILAPEVVANVVGDMQAFIAAREWYFERNIPYRRGYLLYGPPGNGKSSLALAAAGVLNKDLYVLPLGDPMMTDDTLLSLMGGVPQHAVLVIEDIDTIFKGRKNESENKLTMSGVLNAIDGAVAPEGRILIMTTNHVDVLDPALIREGRTDSNVLIDNPKPAQAKELFERFFPGTAGDAFAAWAGDGTHCMAALQGHLLRHRNDPVAASRRKDG